MDKLLQSIKQSLKENDLEKTQNFLTQILSIVPLKDLSTYNIKIDDKKEISLENLCIKIHKEQLEKKLTISEIQDYYHSDKNKFWFFIIELNKKEGLNHVLFNFLKDKFDIQNNLEFLKSIRSFENLSKLEHYGFNIWVPIDKNKELNIKTLLPLAVFEWESIRKDKYNKLSISARVEQLVKHKDKWINIKEFRENERAFKTIIANTLAIISSEINYRKALKSLNIKDKDIIAELIDCSIVNSEKTYTTNEQLLKFSKLGTLSKINTKNKNAQILESENYSPIVKLLISEPMTPRSAGLKTTYKNFVKFWNEIILTINYQEEKNGKNLLEQLLENKIILKGIPKNYQQVRCFFPIKEKYMTNSQIDTNQHEADYISIVKEDIRKDSWIKILKLFEKNGVSFIKENSDGLLLSQIIISLFSYQNESKITELFNDNEFLAKTIDSLTIEKTEKLIQDIDKNWQRLFTENKKKEYNTRYLYQGFYIESALIKMLNLLAQKATPTITKLWDKAYKDLSQYEKNINIAEDLSEINKLILKSKLNNQLSNVNKEKTKFKI